MEVTSAPSTSVNGGVGSVESSFPTESTSLHCFATTEGEESDDFEEDGVLVVVVVVDEIEEESLFSPRFS